MGVAATASRGSATGDAADAMGGPGLQMDARQLRTGSWLLPARLTYFGRVQGCHRPL